MENTEYNKNLYKLLNSYGGKFKDYINKNKKFIVETVKDLFFNKGKSFKEIEFLLSRRIFTDVCILHLN